MKQLLFATLVLSILLSCTNQKPKTTIIQFETMGTYGTVKIVSDSVIDENKIAKDIDSLLLMVNNNFSTYIDSSIISKFNKQDTGLIETGKEFNALFSNAIQYANESNYAFNSQIMPLVLYYGFAYEPGHTVIDSSFIDSVVLLINKKLEDEVKLSILDNNLVKKSNVQLDFSAFAKGYGVDVVANYLDTLGYQNFMVEIGGEVVCKGLNEENISWHIGIEKPNEEVREIYQVVELQNKAMATSGNYRNFKVLENGQKVVHIINPKTGYPEISNLLSASIIADNCMTADAYATACMVMGVDTCFEFVLNHPELECYLIYSDEHGQLQAKYTKYFKEHLVQ